MDAGNRVRRLHFPLFHSTSTLFETSIREFGLGGRDILRELDTRQAAVELLAYADRACTHSKINVDALDRSAHDLLLDLTSNSELAPETNEASLWVLLRVCYGLAKEPEDKPASGCGNFRYGQIYATSSRESALSWAQNVEFGSEALTNLIGLFRVLSRRFPELRASKVFSKILEFTKYESRPLLIEIPNASIDDLLTDTGQSPNEHLRMLEDFFPHFQLNFEIINPVPFQQLLFHKLDSCAVNSDS